MEFHQRATQPPPEHDTTLQVSCGDSPGFSGILRNIFGRFFEISRSPGLHSGILQDSSGFFGILWDFTVSITGFFEILWDALRYFEISKSPGLH